MTPIVIIPARMAASRLPGKPLADIGGMSMILRVLAQVVEQVPAVRDLQRARCSAGGALSVGPGPVPADHPHARMVVGDLARAIATAVIHDDDLVAFGDLGQFCQKARHDALDVAFLVVRRQKDRKSGKPLKGRHSEP